MAKHPTIHDVASRAGVSKSLVSLVMRGAPNVSEGRRTAVLTAVRDLGYRPNLAARSLVRRRSQIIGILVSDLHNPFFHEVVDGVNAAALGVDYRALLTTGELVAGREALAIETLLELRVDGVILGSPRVPRAFVAEVAQNVATIALGFTARTDTYDTIAGDERVGVTSVIAHLVELGHSRIAHVHGSGPGARPRRAQYERAMARHGLERHVRVAAGDFTEAGGASGMRTLMESEPMPTAVFMANDFSAIGALEVLDEAGIRVPQDVSLVGYDGSRVAGLHRIGLTTVDQPRFDMGHLAVTLLLERLEEGRRDAKHVVLPPRLVARETTGPPRG